LEDTGTAYHDVSQTVDPDENRFRADRRRSGNYYSKQSFPWGIRLNPVADYQCTEAAIRTACHCTGWRQSVVSSNLG
jgi:hypothetical protein